MVGRAVVGIASACVVMSGCAFFMEQPGTPLAAAAHEGNVAEIRRLVAEGAHLNEYDASNQTALHWAARGGHRVGPHRCGGEAAGRAEVIAALIELGADVNAVDRRGNIPGGASGWTPLHVALRHEQFTAARTLLERGANPDIRTRQGTTALAIAANEGAPKELLSSIVARASR